MTNPVNWFEIATIDLERAKKFYTEVFKREFTYIEVGETKMHMFNSIPDQNGSGGALVHDKENTPSADGVMIYFTCEDVSVEADRIESAGGKLLFPKMSIGEFGFISQFIDTEGNRIGLHSNK